jgi:hypothetical protein
MELGGILLVQKNLSVDCVDRNESEHFDIFCLLRFRVHIILPSRIMSQTWLTFFQIKWPESEGDYPALGFEVKTNLFRL